MTLPTPSALIQKHGLFTKKSLGQHFLLDTHITDKIALAAKPLEGCTVIEIGPGPGGLTRSLLLAGAERVIAIEKDTRCIAAIQDLGAALPEGEKARLSILEADALTQSIATLGTAPRKIVANLPYNVGTALLTGWLEDPSAISEMVLMFQKEVAERLIAEPGNKNFGRLSILAQYHCHVERLFDLPASAFTPPPKVDSTVVRLTPRPPVISCNPNVLAKLTAAAFGQRRKMLRQSLKSFIAEPIPVLESLGLDPTARAEELSVQDFCRLANAARP